MQRSTVGESSILALGTVESVKWLACAFMLWEHIYRYVIGELPAMVYVLGRTVFPLFAMSVAVGLAGKWQAMGSSHGAWKRMVAGALAAAAFTPLVRDVVPINVLMTLAWGVVLYGFAKENEASAWPLCAGLTLAGFGCEFGPLGVLSVALCCAWVDQRKPAYLAVAMGCACASQMSVVPALAVPVAWVVTQLRIEVPRVRHVFYWIYVGQWPAFVVLRAVT